MLQTTHTVCRLCDAICLTSCAVLFGGAIHFIHAIKVPAMPLLPVSVFGSWCQSPRACPRWLRARPGLGSSKYSVKGHTVIAVYPQDVQCNRTVPKNSIRIRVGAIGAADPVSC